MAEKIRINSNHNVVDCPSCEVSFWNEQDVGEPDEITEGYCHECNGPFFEIEWNFDGPKPSINDYDDEQDL